MCMQNKSLAVIAFLSSLLLTCASGLAQSESSDAQSALRNAESKLVAVLDNTDNLFYKTTKNGDAPTRYSVRWEEDGAVSNIVLLLRPLGTYKKEPLFGLLAYIVVAESENPFPPSVIKMVTVKSDTCVLGAYSMTENFNTIYISTTIPSDTLTPGQLWMTCSYLHMHNGEAKKEIEKIVAEFGK